MDPPDPQAEEDFRQEAQAMADQLENARQGLEFEILDTVRGRMASTGEQFLRVIARKMSQAIILKSLEVGFDKYIQVVGTFCASTLCDCADLHGDQGKEKCIVCPDQDDQASGG